MGFKEAMHPVKIEGMPQLMLMAGGIHNQRVLEIAALVFTELTLSVRL